jgi:hypothetical protein
MSNISTGSAADEELGRLDAERLLDLLIHGEDRTPRNVVEACAAQGEAMVGALRRAVDGGRAWAEDGASGDWWLMLHAAMVLGRIPTASAGLELVRLMRRIAAEEDDNLQDWLAGHWPALFENKPLEVVDAARALAEDRALDWYIRCQAVEVVVDAALRESAQALEEALDWVAAAAADESGDWDMRVSAASTLLDFPRERHRNLLEDIARRAVERVGRERWRWALIAPEDVEQAYARGRDEPCWKRSPEPWRFYSPGAIAERQQRWAKENAEAPEDGFDDLPMPYTRETPKIGRNDPCPCGSGKKYKKCCLLRESGNTG